MRLPTYFVSHGGGPWPWMKEELGAEYDKLEAALSDMPRQLGARPRAVLVVSGHWETPDFAVMANPAPPMIYDYGGFPAHTYRVRYAAPGAPDLAVEVCRLLDDAGLPARLDAERGYDHGAFVPLSVIYPNADVPAIQLSVQQSLDPETHLRVGRALAPLRDAGVLMVGSGMSYHNLRRMGASAQVPSREFDGWLARTLDAPPDERRRSLLAWAAAPSARAAHPREEHLIPLMVALGAAEQETVARVFYDENLLGGLVVSSYRFGKAALD